MWRSSEERPTPMTCDFCVCVPDADTAEALAEQYLGTYLASVADGGKAVVVVAK